MNIFFEHPIITIFDNHIYIINIHNYEKAISNPFKYVGPGKLIR